jgi:hypothetical protein
MYAKCPKCNAAIDALAPEAGERCPSCGLVFAKYLQARQGKPVPIAPATPEPGAQADDGPAGKLAELRERVLEPPPGGAGAAFYGRCAAFLFFFVWGIRLYAMDISDAEINGSFMHVVVLTFHEAGHVVFVPFGRFMTILGGSLFQVLVPLGLMVAFIFGLGGSKRDNFAAALMLWWAGVAIIDVAPYIWDAYDPKIMLLGGKTGAESDGHDWQNILGDLGLLKRAHFVGQLAHKTGLLVMLAGLGWAALLLYRQLRDRGGQPAEDLELEEKFKAFDKREK